MRRCQGAISRAIFAAAGASSERALNSTSIFENTPMVRTRALGLKPVLIAFAARACDQRRHVR
eukprot:6269225-Prymnesium_polylepis.1